MTTTPASPSQSDSSVLAALQLANSILALTPSVITLITQIRADVNAGNSSADVAAMLAQIDANHAAVLALLAQQ